MSYVVETNEDEGERTATLRFVGEHPYRSEEDLKLVPATASMMQESVRRTARRKGKFTWLTILACVVLRRHLFIDFKIASTGGHFVMCARCFKVSKMYQERLA